MTGIILALLYFAWEYFISNISFVAGYQNATGFLFWWYVAWTVVLGLVCLVIALLMALGLGAAGVENLGLFGGLLGFFGGGGAVTLALAVRFIAKRGSLLFGAYLLQTAWTGEGWDIARIVFGAILLFVGILLWRSRSSLSSSKD